MTAISLGSTKGLEKGHGNKTPGVGQGGVASFVPIAVVFATNNMKEVASRKAELLAIPGFVIVECFDDLLKVSVSSKSYGDRSFEHLPFSEE